MIYTIRAYASRVQGESGRYNAVNECKTGDWNTAKHAAKGFAEYYGAAVAVNNNTGERHWF